MNMKKLTGQQTDELHAFIRIMTKYLVGVGGIKNRPLVNVQSQDIDKTLNWTWFKMGFYFTCGAGFAIYLSLCLTRVIHFLFNL